jgi:hypothetical protein
LPLPDEGLLGTLGTGIGGIPALVRYFKLLA